MRTYSVTTNCLPLSVLFDVRHEQTKPAGDYPEFSGNALNMQFAQDFEKILVEEADKQYGLDKVKLAFQDLLKGQRVGILKWYVRQVPRNSS
jgi:hypothetical protein